MALAAKLKNYLEKNKIGYTIIPHKKVYTTFDLTQTLKKAPEVIAKSLLVKADKKYLIIVLPAHLRLNLVKLKKVLSAKNILIAGEPLMKKILKMKEGTIAPFGGLNKMELALEKSLAKLKKFIVRGGNFTESLEVPVRDYIKIEKPIIASFGDKISGFAKAAFKSKKAPLKKRKSQKNKK